MRIRCRFNHDVLRVETHYERSVLKSGKPGKGWVMYGAWYTPLRTCERCKIVSTPKKIQYRSQCHGLSAMLCMGCWNRIKPLSQAMADERFTKWATGKIQREARKHGNEKR